ncbi:MAG: RHS repeat-associated core domain-containing protein [Taibaiella sp.]|nr:RHS repeat-associated core domain-containing protein [Taibaiella sp.]
MILERTTVHISDPPTALGTGAGRIAMLEKRIIGTDDAEEVLTRYVYSNHLQSASLELDEYANIISYEEYHPYGTTAFQAKNASINAVAKRYRYTGKKRDEESGLYYHGARYYIPWLCKWVSVDPINNENYNLAKGYGLEKNLERDFIELSASSYEYCLSNPINFNDPSGERYRPTSNFGLTYSRPAISSWSINPQGRFIPQRGQQVRIQPRGPVNIGRPGFRPNLAIRPSLQPGSMWRPALTTPVVARPLMYNRSNSDASYVVTRPILESPEQKFRKFAQSLNGGNSAPFVSMSAKKEYEKAQRITTEISNLSEQERNQIAHRIATGQASNQDLIYAPLIMRGTGGGTFRNATFGDNWPRASLSDATRRFTPNFVLSMTEQKLQYSDANTGFTIFYDKEGDYFRIENSTLTGKRRFVDLTGIVPNNKIVDGRTIGRSQAEYNQVTHFKNTDRQNENILHHSSNR